MTLPLQWGQYWWTCSAQEHYAGFVHLLRSTCCKSTYPYTGVRGGTPTRCDCPTCWICFPSWDEHCYANWTFRISRVESAPILQDSCNPLWHWGYDVPGDPSRDGPPICYFWTVCSVSCLGPPSPAKWLWLVVLDWTTLCTVGFTLPVIPLTWDYISY